MLLGAASCALIQSQGDVVEKDGVHLLVAPDELGEAGVGYVTSRLVLVDDCVGLDLGAMGSAVVIWPHGTEVVSSDPLVIDVPGVGHVREGDQLHGGGDDYEGSNPLPGVDVPASCQGRLLVSFTPDHR